MRLSKVLVVSAAASVAGGANLSTSAQQTQQVIIKGPALPPIEGRPFADASLWNPYSASDYYPSSLFGSSSYYPEGEGWTITDKGSVDAAKAAVQAAAENAASQWKPPCIFANETVSQYQARATLQCGNDVYSKLPAHSVWIMGVWARLAAAKYVCTTAIQPKIVELAVMRSAEDVCRG